MYLTLTSTAPEVGDLGHLLHKHPERAQQLEVSAGFAHVFHSESGDDRCTVALLLEVDPIALVRRRRHGGDEFALGQHVNDRPCAASSMLAVALGKVFRTTVAGRCDARPELVDVTLGWTVQAEPLVLDESIPSWGSSRHVDLRKSTFARPHFGAFEVLSGDHCRGLVSDDENDQSATSDAFDVHHHVVGKRLAAGRLTFVDVTNVQQQARRSLVDLARANDDVLPAVPPPSCTATPRPRSGSGTSRPSHWRPRPKSASSTCATCSASESSPPPTTGGSPCARRARRERWRQQLIWEEKHVGPRAVVLVCRDPAVATTRFGGTGSGLGAVCTRTGRSFFDPATTADFLDLARTAIDRAALWDDLQTDWVLLDAEIPPWSVKAVDLLGEQYASVGAAAGHVLPRAPAGLTAARSRGIEVGELTARTRSRAANAEASTAAYRRYCWPTEGRAGIRLAPFPVLATQGATDHDRDHASHLDVADRLAAAAPEPVAPTSRVVVDTGDPTSVLAGVQGSEALTAARGPGMVVTPLANLTCPRQRNLEPDL